MQKEINKFSDNSQIDKIYIISDNLNDISESINKSLEKITHKSIFKKILHKIYPKSSLKEIELIYNDLDQKEIALRKEFDELIQMKNYIKIENDKLFENKDEGIDWLLRLKCELADKHNGE